MMQLLAGIGLLVVLAVAYLVGWYRGIAVAADTALLWRRRTRQFRHWVNVRQRRAEEAAARRRVASSDERENYPCE